MVEWRVIQVTGVNLFMITTIVKGKNDLNEVRETNWEEN